ncbi:MAG: thioesterase domain-containing protein [Gemmatimonadetes bacterium]|nr:thioesterase domain-containing protein [Gemmatimonadota bacterium]
MPDSFSARRLQRMLQDHIPLAREMGAEVQRWTGDVLELTAPLEPNLNHHGTFFGGSASALGILAGWSLVHLSCLEAGLDAEVVIQRVAVRYVAPAPGPVMARSYRPDPTAWRRFEAGYRRHGLARLRVRVELHCGGLQIARLETAYAAIRATDPDATPGRD